MRKVIVTSLLLASMGLGACTETTGGMAGGGGVGLASVSAQKTPAERQLEADAKSLNQVTSNIIVRNTLEGAAVGALAGCGLVLLMGGDGDDCARGAALGAVAGGVAGNQVGQAAAAKKTELVKRDQVLANLKGVSAKLNGVETSLRAVLRSQNSEIASLKRQLANKQISDASYRARLNAINANRRTVDAALATSERNMSTTRNELQAASKGGQKNLATLSSAAASTQARLARNRKLLAIAN
ncbi:hypothetical protein PUH89_07360 [Rhodobacter capsulatus]|uniref:Glycine zipper domain-containing protein n=1 Tax=Rhodobacter capsulatus TaxID=1061 RepID=A0A1G7CSX3_RHOCA|nr:hypothetical protein [Rhodobacter capsulatus]WER10781.1 hypothetical protein PUH89_07360 [Rhodobacter capsulatus]SDE42524.1 hypothetical protein SAMN04244550_00372 [Rhodobacter capsulatus]